MKWQRNFIIYKTMDSYLQTKKDTGKWLKKRLMYIFLSSLKEISCSLIN